MSDFHDLIAYQKATDLSCEIFELTKTFPPEEPYFLTSQIRRASRSVGANIAEGYRKRNYPKHFTSKLTDANAENAETKHWIFTAERCMYLPKEKAEELVDKNSEIRKLLLKMINDMDDFF
jgi:four helix bundle protein